MPDPIKTDDAVPMMTPAADEPVVDGVDGGTIEGQDPAAGDTPDDLGEVTSTLFPEGHPAAPKKTDLPAKKDPSRFEFHQARADRAEAQLKQLAPVIPIAQFLQQNPDVVERIEAQMRSGAPLTATPPAVAPQTKQGAEDTLVMPTAPTKPDNYNSVEAVTDANSVSFKYRAAQEEYQEKLADYLAKREALRADQEQQMAAEQQRQTLRTQKMSAAKSELISKYGMTEAEANDFLATMTKPEAFNLGNLVKLYRVQQTNAQGKRPPVKTNQGRTDLPPSLAAIGGETEPALTEEEQFNLGLLRHRKQKPK